LNLAIEQTVQNCVGTAE